MLKHLTRLRNISGFVTAHKKLLVDNPSKQYFRAFTKTISPANEHNDTVEETRKHSNPFASAMPQQSEEELALSAEEQERRLKVLQLEVDIAYQDGRRVPSLEFFEDHHWDYVLALPTKSARYKYYGYLWQIEMKKQSKERKKDEKAEAVAIRKDEQRRERDENTHIIYGLGHTSLFLRIYDSTINHWQNNRLTRAMQFSPKIVLDCSYDRNMNHREATNAAKQLMLCFAENRAHDEPFDLHYCNVNMKSVSIQGLQRYIPTMLNPEFPMNVHEKCFTEVFPKENLVYLTPHCRTDLEIYNPDDVYIIGAMVDTVNNEPLSLAKAKKLGLRMARLPLDRYLQWGSGSGKSLTLNQMINIMLDLKRTGDWTKSLVHVPRRKIINMEMEQQRQRSTWTKRADQLNVGNNRYSDYSRNKTPKTGEHKVHSYKDKMQFNLDTWGAKKDTRNS